LRAQPETRNQEFFMSFMLKIAFALQVTVAGAVGLGTSTSTSASTSALTEQATPAPVVDRASCEVCDEVYDNCIAEGLTPAGCTRLVANCRKNCLP
jgi:hypothetical protein